MNQMDQVNFFAENGYLLIEDMFSASEVENLNNQVAALGNQPGVITEHNSEILRSLNGSHKHNKHLSEICHHHAIVTLVKKILASDIYVHQFKINMKAAFHGDVWDWHQDHIFWLKEDGMLKPDAITVAIFLTDANEFNAPLMLIPRSHQLGTVDVSSDGQEEGWESTVSAKLKYTAPQALVREQVQKNDIVSAKGKAGSVLLFHCNTLHASTKNISPLDRVMLMISYNSMNNKLEKVKNPRPGFLVERDPVAINIL